MKSNSEKQKTSDEAGLENLNRHLQTMEKMLHKADGYNRTLSEQINNLKDIFKSNHKVFNKLQDTQQSLGNILMEDYSVNEDNFSKLIQRLAAIENKLFVTVSLFNDYKCRVRDKSNMQDNDVSKLCNQIDVLGTNLLSVGNQLKSMCQDKMSKEHDANNLLHWSCNASNHTNISWTQYKTQMKDMLEISQLNMVQSREKPCLLDSNIEETPIRQIRYQKKIIQRIESILTKAEHYNIRSETLTNFKVLAKNILIALVKRNQFCSTEHSIGNNKHSTLRAIPRSLCNNPYLV